MILAGCAAAFASLALAGTAMADQPSGGGSFVMSDQNAAVGYEGDPGHPGTGTVVEVVCGGQLMT